MSPAPRDLIGIGEFSRRSGLSIKALRHYHRLGILLPVHVDPASGYRYYGPDQVAQVEACRALTLVGVPLRRVRELLRGGLPAPDLRATLLEAREHSGERLRAEAARLSWLEASLAALDRSAASAEEPARAAGLEVDFVPVRARPIVSWREAVVGVADGDALCDELARRWGPGDEVEAVTVWHDCGRSTGRVDCEAAISADLVSSRAALRVPGLRSGLLDAAWVARVRPTDPAASVDDAYLAGWRRLASLDLRLAGPVREWVRYAGGRGEVREIHFPIARM